MKQAVTPIGQLPHMGEFIKEKIQDSMLTYAEVCRRIDIKQPTMTSYFWQDTSQTRTIWKISHAINHNLFTDLIQMMPKELQDTNKTSFQETITAQQREIEDLKKEIAIYKEILSKRV